MTWGGGFSVRPLAAKITPWKSLVQGHGNWLRQVAELLTCNRARRALNRPHTSRKAGTAQKTSPLNTLASGAACLWLTPYRVPDLCFCLRGFIAWHGSGTLTCRPLRSVQVHCQVISRAQLLFCHLDVDHFSDIPFTL